MSTQSSALSASLGLIIRRVLRVLIVAFSCAIVVSLVVTAGYLAKHAPEYFTDKSIAGQIGAFAWCLFGVLVILSLIKGTVGAARIGMRRLRSSA